MKEHHCQPQVLKAFDAALKNGAQSLWGLIAGPNKTVFLDENSGYWILDNGEYSGPIFFCPWCGVSLPRTSVTA